MNYIKLKALTKKKNYKYLTRGIIIIYALFIGVYISRDQLYTVNNQYLTIFAWTAPNLFSSYLFSLVGLFYLVPLMLGNHLSINKSIYLWLINLLNISIFILIEIMHVIFNLGIWDTKDIIASAIGIGLATLTYYKLRDFLSDNSI